MASRPGRSAVSTAVPGFDGGRPSGTSHRAVVSGQICAMSSAGSAAGSRLRRPAAPGATGRALPARDRRTVSARRSRWSTGCAGPNAPRPRAGRARGDSRVAGAARGRRIRRPGASRGASSSRRFAGPARRRETTRRPLGRRRCRAESRPMPRTASNVAVSGCASIDGIAQTVPAQVHGGQEDQARQSGRVSPHGQGHQHGRRGQQCRDPPTRREGERYTFRGGA